MYSEKENTGFSPKQNIRVQLPRDKYKTQKKLLRRYKTYR